MRKPSSTPVERDSPEGGRNGVPGHLISLGQFERSLESDELHHVVARSRGGSNKTVNLTPAEPRRHDWYHDITDNSLPTEVMLNLATSTVGYSRHRTIEPRCLETIYQIATMLDWPELYVPGSITPSGTVESLSRPPRLMYRHANEHQISQLFHLDAAQSGLKHDHGYAWQKSSMLKRFMRFADTPDDPLAAMRQLLTEEYHGRLTWVDALQEQTRRDLLVALEDTELVPLTQGTSAELQGIVAKQRAIIAQHAQIWTRSYEANYGRGRKKKHAATRMRHKGNRH